MHIIDIRSERDAPEVFARLQSLGEAWRPADDVPCLVYLDGGDSEEIRRIPGVVACWRRRSGRAARVLHEAARARGREAARTRAIDVARGRALDRARRLIDA